MGTRGAFGFRVDEKDWITYNHFDSYPSGLGQHLVNQLKKILQGTKIKDLRNMARKVELVDEQGQPSDMYKDLLRLRANLSVSSQSEDDWYCLLRNFQGQLVELLVLGVMIDSHKFMTDSLFCEWAYIVNFDTEKFEIYEGFQKEKHDKGRYANLPPYDDEGRNWPVALIGEIDFNKLFGIEELESYMIAHKMIEEEEE